MEQLVQQQRKESNERPLVYVDQVNEGRFEFPLEVDLPDPHRDLVFLRSIDQAQEAVKTGVLWSVGGNMAFNVLLMVSLYIAQHLVLVDLFEY